MEFGKIAYDTQIIMAIVNWENSSFIVAQGFTKKKVYRGLAVIEATIFMVYVYSKSRTKNRS